MLLWINTSTEVDKVADMVVKTLNEDFTDVTLVIGDTYGDWISDGDEGGGHGGWQGGWHCGEET